MRDSYDVIVAGGGVAGVAAALAAARDGARTLLLERQAWLGGTPVALFHRALCGLYASPVAGAAPALLHDGLTREIHDELRARAPERTPRRMGRVFVLPFAVQDLMDILHAKLRRIPTIAIRLGAEVVAADFSDPAVAVLRLQPHPAAAEALPRSAALDAPGTVRAKTVIDASGDGIVARLCGAAHPLTPPDELPYAGYAARLTQAENVSRELLTLRAPFALRKATLAGTGVPWLPYAVFQAGDRADEVLVKLSLPPAPHPLFGPDTAQQTVEEALAVLRRACPEFRAGRVAEVSPHPVQREGARLRGRYTLTAADVLAARQFPHAAARNAWPVEFWRQNAPPRYRYVEPGRSGTIPIACLQSALYPRLWAAGRCLSATSQALASCRVIGVCLPLGAAAGAAAAAQARQTKT
jgi:2-polyprenyl-6-methoxyphenol hydroxylase-like FAD-dependent oxidoreductase